MCSPRTAAATLPIVAACWIALTAAPPAVADPAAVAAYQRELKALQHEILLEEGAEALERAAAIRRAGRIRGRAPHRGQRSRPTRLWSEAGFRPPAPPRRIDLGLEA